MFTRAGFNPRSRVVCRAFLMGVGYSMLIRFIPSGDFCWYSPRGRWLKWNAEPQNAIRFGITPTSYACPIDGASEPRYAQWRPAPW